LLAQAEDEAEQPTALLLIPGRAPKKKQELASKKHFLLYYRLGMALASLIMLVVAVVSLSGVRPGAMAFDMAASQEGNAASYSQAGYNVGVSGMNLSANSALAQNGSQLPSSAPPPPLGRLKPTPPPAPPAPPPGAPSGPYSSWTPPPGYPSFAVKDFAGDPWAGSFGQCTWWAHYKRPDENLSGIGDAWNWANGARARGYTVTSTPAANSTIVFAPGVQGASSLGHVAHVEQVLTGGWVLISEMNFYWNGGGFARVDYRYASVGPGVLFIH
jgi:surface antigen